MNEKIAHTIDLTTQVLTQYKGAGKTVFCAVSGGG